MPLLRGGADAPIKKMTALPYFGAAGRSVRSPAEVADLPRCALSKVAFHLLIGRNGPSSEEGQTRQGTELLPINRKREKYISSHAAPLAVAGIHKQHPIDDCGTGDI